MKKDYISTYSKIHFTPTSPREEDINIEDIAHALSFLCRANGHIKHFYSVAQHSIQCCLEANARGYSKRVQLACLLHDGSEAYISDITRPVKQFLAEYKTIEKRLQQTIFRTYFKKELTPEELSLVREIDDHVLYFEFYALTGEYLPIQKAYLMYPASYNQKAFEEVKKDFLTLFHTLHAQLS
jgi:hypothetical protein